MEAVEEYLGDVTAMCEMAPHLVPGRFIARKGSVFLSKFCREHGRQESLVATDVDYFRRSRDVSTRVATFQDPIPEERGCPDDCGPCTAHASPVGALILEILDECNLRCATCIAASHPGAGKVKSLDQVARLVDGVRARLGHLPALMLSGGEPTVHDQFFEIVAAAYDAGSPHVFVITNGVRIADDPRFAERLREYPSIEVCLQFDSLSPAALRSIRGEDLSDVRRRALDALEANGVRTTLICVVKGGVNDGEVADLVKYAASRENVVGITFQPMKNVGRTELFDKFEHLVTLTDVRRSVVSSGLFRAGDIVPHPSSPETVAIGYMSRSDGAPLTRRALAGRTSDGDRPFYLSPRQERELFAGTRPFRAAVVSYLDCHSFTTTAARRSSLFFLDDAGRVIPADTYYLFYRR